MHLQTLDLLDTRAPSLIMCAEGDVLTELEEWGAPQTHCIIYSSPLVAQEDFFAPFPVNSFYVLIKYIFLLQFFPSKVSFFFLFNCGLWKFFGRFLLN